MGYPALEPVLACVAQRSCDEQRTRYRSGDTTHAAALSRARSAQGLLGSLCKELGSGHTPETSRALQLIIP